MDLRTSHERMGVQDRYSSAYESHMFNVTETFEETDIKGNNNLLNFLKTEANNEHDHNSDSLYQVKDPNKKKLEVDNSLFSYSSFKKAMDLRTHNRTLDGGKRSIFEDAEYFSKNYFYKLLPITFDHVDESMIQLEHNYSLFSLMSESEPEEDCSRMMDYTQIKQKNYKRRRTKFREGGHREELVEDATAGGSHSPPMLSDQSEGVTAIQENTIIALPLEPESSATIQPLDLSAAPLVQGEKTDTPLRVHPKSISECSQVTKLHSDKENLNSKLNGILVTITRPDEKENYQPCDLFLKDIARLVPRLIDKDCFEVDILDRTCDDQDEFRKHRLYYIISESTWRLFQRTNERVILTNDQSLGPPLQKVEKVEKPSYLIFDQFSLAKCLAEYCHEIGGCFEYTCVEDGKEEVYSGAKSMKETGNDLKSKKEPEKIAEAMELDKGEFKADGATKKSKERGAKMESVEEEMQEAIEPTMEKVKEEDKGVISEPEGTSSSVLLEQEKRTSEKMPTSVSQSTWLNPFVRNSEENVLFVGEAIKRRRRKSASLETYYGQVIMKNQAEEKETKIVKSRTKFPAQPKARNRVATRSKFTSESEASQKSDKQKRRKRGGSGLRKTEPPNKHKKSALSKEFCRKTRSGRIFEEPKTNKPVVMEKERAKAKTGTKATPGKVEGTGRTLRSRTVAQEKEKRRMAASKSGKW